MTAELPKLNRNRVLPPALDFKALLELGILRAQEASGTEWTDYNLHDPGVTILEQACFALVDIAYRASHPIEDLIETVFAADADHQAALPGPDRDARMAVDFPLPYRALSSPPVTHADFQAAILDAFPDVRTVWITSQLERCAFDGTDFTGTSVRLLPYSNTALPDYDHLKLRNEVEDYLGHHRLLGQTFSDVSLIEVTPYEFDATLVVEPGREPDDLIAAVLHAVDLALCPPLLFQAHTSADTLTPDVRFNGPLLNAGLPGAWDTPDPQATRNAAWLQRVVRDVDGVVAVQDVRVPRASPDKGAVFGIDRSDTARFDAIRIVDPVCGSIGAMRLDAEAETLRKSHITLSLAHRLGVIRDESSRLRRQTRQALATQLPKAKPRARMDHYHSIQYGFPAVYGLGGPGPTSSGNARPRPTPDGLGPKTPDTPTSDEVRNLRAFLTLLEQPLADMLQQLRLAPDLLSAGAEPGKLLGATYRAADLGDETTGGSPGFSELLTCDTDYNNALSNAVSRADAQGGRYEKFLDHLLARYDERFDNAVLKKFDVPTNHARQMANRARIEAKQRFLHEIVGDAATAEDGIHIGIGLASHRGSAAENQDLPCKSSAFARRVELKTLLPTPLAVLEHQMLHGIDVPDNRKSSLFWFDTLNSSSKWQTSIAFKVQVPGPGNAGTPSDTATLSQEKLHVFLHLAKPLNDRPIDGVDLHGLIADVLAGSILRELTDPETGTKWYAWCQKAKTTAQLILLSPVRAPYDSTYNAFAHLSKSINHPLCRQSLCPVVFPSRFSASRLTVVAETKSFANVEASTAYNGFVRDTVMAEAPAALEVTFTTADAWPRDTRNDLVLGSVREMRAALMEWSTGNSAERNLAGLRLMRTSAETAYRQHLATLDNLVNE